MNRRRTFLIVFVILVLILVVGIGALLLLRGGLLGGDAQPTVQVGDGGIPTLTPEIVTKRVVVALQTIPRGMRIPPDAVEIREWPINDPAFPSDPIYNLEDAVGMTARVEIPMHRPVSASKIKVVFQGEGSEFSLAIPKGRVLYAIPIKAISAVANAVQPGDRVDVMISFLVVDVEQSLQAKLPVAWAGDPELCMEAACQAAGEQIPRLVSQYTVQNALVLGVGMWTGEPDIAAVRPSEMEDTTTPGETQVTQVIEGEGEAAPVAAQNIAVQLTDIRVISLVVDPQDALVLKWLLESNASIDMVMRSAIDQDVYSTEAVTLKYMLDRFAISLPPKLATVPENKFKYSLIDTMLEYQQSTAQPAQ